MTAAPLVAAGRSTGDVAERPLVIVRDVSLGGFRVNGANVDTSPARAIHAFGRTGITRTGTPLQPRCRASWPSLDLVLIFYKQRGPCLHSAFLKFATVRGQRWRTDRGLEIGDPVARLRRLYPKARRHLDGSSPAGFWLITYVVGCGVTAPSLLATTSGDRVSSLTVFARETCLTRP